MEPDELEQPRRGFSSMARCRHRFVPPTRSTASRRSKPNAPKMIMRAPSRVHPARPGKNARAYSTIWRRSIQRRGIRSSPGRPISMTAPFSGRMVPPTAMTVSSSMNSRDARGMASASNTESESTGRSKRAPPLAEPGDDLDLVPGVLQDVFEHHPNRPVVLDGQDRAQRSLFPSACEVGDRRRWLGISAGVRVG